MCFLSEYCLSYNVQVYVRLSFPPFSSRSRPRITADNAKLRRSSRFFFSFPSRTEHECFNIRGRKLMLINLNAKRLKRWSCCGSTRLPLAQIFDDSNGAISGGNPWGFFFLSLFRGHAFGLAACYLSHKAARSSTPFM